MYNVHWEKKSILSFKNQTEPNQTSKYLKKNRYRGYNTSKLKKNNLDSIVVQNGLVIINSRNVLYIA